MIANQETAIETMKRQQAEALEKRHEEEDNHHCPHPCDPTDEEMEALKLRASLKRSVTAHDEDLKVLYEQVAGRYPATVRERVPLKSILPTLYKKRQALPTPAKRCPVRLWEKRSHIALLVAATRTASNVLRPSSG